MTNFVPCSEHANVRPISKETAAWLESRLLFNCLYCFAATYGDAPERAVADFRARMNRKVPQRLFKPRC